MLSYIDNEDKTRKANKYQTYLKNPTAFIRNVSFIVGRYYNPFAY